MAEKHHRFTWVILFIVVVSLSRTVKWNKHLDSLMSMAYSSSMEELRTSENVSQLHHIVSVDNNKDSQNLPDNVPSLPMISQTASWLEEGKKNSLCGARWNDFQKHVIGPLQSRVNHTSAPYAWTVSGGEMYRQHLPELMNQWKRLGVNVLVVALDQETALLACKLGYEAAYWDSPAQSYSRVADSKFQVTAILAETGIDQFFVELDVFCRESPVPLMEQSAKAANANIVTVGHGDLQQKINIGMYYVRASPPVGELFRLVVDALAPSLDSKYYYRSTRDNKRAFFDQETFHDCVQYNTRHPEYYVLDDVNHTHNLLQRCQNYNLTTAMISNLYINSYMPPTIHDSTICIHPLANTPFSSFKMKLATAKFLDFDPNPIRPSDRFLKTVSGDIVYSEDWNDGFFADDLNEQRYQKMFKYQAALLIQLAKDSNRTLILPRHVRDKSGKAFPVYSLLNTVSVEESTPWRFLSREQARSLQANTTVVSLANTRSIEDARTRLRESCSPDQQVCALHGVRYASRFPIGNRKELDDVIGKLQWCLPREGDKVLGFTQGLGHFEHPCGSGY